MSRSLLVTLTTSPYASSRARAGLDLALASAAFDKPVSLLFLGSAVLQLLDGQDTEALGLRNQRKTLDSAALYGIDAIYADAKALAQLGITQQELPDGCQTADAAQIRKLLNTYDQLVSV